MKRNIIKKISTGAIVAGAVVSLSGCKMYNNNGEYNVIYNTNGGDVIANDVIKWGEEITTLKTPTKAGHTFEGWYMDSEFKEEFKPFKLKEDTTVYAKWTINSYTVSFNTNGAGTISPITGEYGSDVQVQQPSKDGYGFAGWFIDETFKVPFNGKIPGSDITVYAKWAASKCIITFDKNNADAEGKVDNLQITSGVKCKLPKNEFQLVGYTFKGWALEANGDVVYKNEEEITRNAAGNITLYAIWDANDYEINFVSNGTSFEKKTLEYKTDVVFPTTNPTLAGHTFAGWGTYTESTDTKYDGSKVYYSLVGTKYEKVDFKAGDNITSTVYEITPYTGKVQANNFSLYAIFTRNELQITYKSEGQDDDVVKAYYGLKTNVNTPTKEHYTFGGWYTNDSFSSQFLSNIPLTESTTLYAKWTINSATVSFETEEGNFEPQTYNYGAKVTLPLSTKTGYTHTGWATELNGAKVYDATEEIDFNFDSNITLYAIYTENTDTAYIVRHKMEKLDGTFENDDENMTGTTATNTAAVAKTVTGFTASPVTQKTIAADGSTIVEITYMRNKYTITFVDTDSNPLGSIEVKYGDTINNADSSFAGTLAKEGQKINSYSVADPLTTAITSSFEVVVEYKDLAQYIGFNTNGGSAIDPIEANIGDDISSLIPDDPTKTGYTFAGWYTDSDCTEGKEYEIPTEMPEDSLTIYAKWTINSYDLSVNYGNGDTARNEKVDYNALLNITAPTYKGYTFDGWYTNTEFSGDAYTITDASTMPAGALTLYAKWTAKSIKVTYKCTGKADKEITLTYDGASHTILNQYPETGYTAYFIIGEDTTKAYQIGESIALDEDLYDYILANNEDELVDIVLNVQYSINHYSYTFHTTGINVSTGEKETHDVTLDNLEYNTNVPFDEPDGYYDDEYFYAFVGWKDSQDESADLFTIESLGKVAASNKEYTAVYNKSTYTIEYLDGYEGTKIYEASSTANDKEFTDYVKTIYNQFNAYTFMDEAIKNIVTYNAMEQLATGSGDVTDTYRFTAINVYLGYLAQKDTANSTIFATVLDGEGCSEEQWAAMKALYDSGDMTYKTQVEGILAAYAQYVSDGFVTGLGLQEVAKAGGVAYLTLDVCNEAADNLKYLANDLQYLALFAQSAFAADTETPTNTTSDRLLTYQSQYNNFKDSAYYPYKNDESYFNGFGISADYTESKLTKYANWAKKPDTPENIKMDKITSSSIKISWDEVENVYEYRVYVKHGSVLVDTITTQQTSAQISVTAGESINITVVAVPQDSDGSILTNPKEFSNVSFEDSAITLKTDTSINLISDESVVFSYTHIVTGETSITSSGDYYYVGESQNLYLFTNISYEFSNYGNIIITSGNSLAEYNEGKLVTKSSQGSFEFDAYRFASGLVQADVDYYDNTWSKITLTVGETIPANCYTKEHKSAHVGLLLSSIDYGTSLNYYDNTTKDIANRDFQNKILSAYTVGKAETVETLGYYDFGGYFDEETKDTYYNGVKFDFVANTTNGFSIDYSLFDLEYTFKDSLGNVITDTSDLFVHDDKTDAFYFLKTGTYTVVVSFKKDVYEETKDATYKSDKIYYTYSDGKYTKFTGSTFEGGVTYYELVYVNMTLPNAYKSQSFEKSFTFTINEGANVYTDKALKASYNNGSCAGINILDNIEVKLDADMVGYIEYYNGGVGSGELDIVSGSAVMTTANGYGPKIWARSSSQPASGFYFTDKEGYYYTYNVSGGYAIKECNWVENYESGKFKICQGTMTNGTYSSLGLRAASPYQRINTTTDITVNGNYYKLDGSKLPFMTSKNHVSMEGTIAAYTIQSVNSSIFQTYANSKSSFNNLEIICNTMDASNYLAQHGDSTSIADYMSKTSGGINGIRSSRNGNNDYTAEELSAITENNPTLTNNEVDVNNVIIRNSLIALYIDFSSTCKADYVYIDETWANSLYSCGGGHISFTNSCVKNSGGASYHLEDTIYAYNYSKPFVVNPELYIDYSTSTTENYISGEEQWFKAYSMEVLALGMKSQFEAAMPAISAFVGTDLTILNLVTDPVTGLETEKMNLVFLSKTDHIGSQQEKINTDGADAKKDINVDLAFGTFCQNIDENTNVYLDSNNTQILVNQSPAGSDATLITIMEYPSQNVIKRYLSFKSNLGTYEIYGMVEVFEKTE